jgi:aspartate/methionine/tyrosine aminotransferase
MKPSISRKTAVFKNTKSLVREIMDLANPEFFKRVGLNPDEVISFSGGWVNHESPDELREAYAAVVQDGTRFHKCGAYPPTIGMVECRRALADLEKHLYGASMQLGPENIAIGCSSTQITLNLMQILLDPGDSILLPDPSYCNYLSQLSSLENVKVIRFPVLDTKQWRYTAQENRESFAAVIRREKPKVVLLCAPDNPTSQIPPTAFVQAALEAVEEIGGFLVIDFAYKALVWDQTVPEYFSWGPTEHYMTIHSNSKWCRGLGRRLGWLEGPVEIIEAMESVQGSSILCPDSLHQMALTEYIEQGIACNSIKPYIRRTAELYRTAAQRTVQAVERFLKMPCLVPQGGLYTVVRTDVESSAFARRILENTGVIVVPGWGFGDTLQQAVRLSYGPLVNDLDKIDEAMRRIGVFLNR